MHLKAGMLLKTHVEKMSVLCLSMMLMKTNKLGLPLHYVDEKKGGYRKPEMTASPACANYGGSPICFSGSEPRRSALEMARRPLEMLKMKIEPTMYMKTQKTTTKCHAKNAVFCGKMHQMSRKKRNRSVFWTRMHGSLNVARSFRAAFRSDGFMPPWRGELAATQARAGLKPGATSPRADMKGGIP
jgi:hypothetical protein